VRTTIDIDEDILLATKEIARQRGVAMGTVLSELARRALTGGGSITMRNGLPVIPRRPGSAVVTPELVKRLMDEEE
jgi:hypothetical protein